jgi:NAD(P)-dependent dehydrogenase (short-subunit alcohol dehydrogenase family)
MTEKPLAVVTGGSGQLGPIWCETLRDMGYRIFDIDLPQYDVSDRERIQFAANRCIAVHGVPKVIVLNAAIDNPPGSTATFHGNLDRIIDVNLNGACYVTEAFLPAMIKAGGGVIIGIVSIMGRVGADWRNYEGDFEKPVAYGLSKAALEQYARSLTVQYGRYGIRACCLGFGPFNGGKLDSVFLGKFLKNVPLGRPVSVESVKAALTFAVNCPEFAGQTVMIEGGYLSV